MRLRESSHAAPSLPAETRSRTRYTRRIVSDAGAEPRSGGQANFGAESETENENDEAASRVRHARFHAVCHRRTSERRQLGNMASGIYNLVMQISRGYDRPIIEVTEEGCSYREAPCEQENERVPDGRCIQFFREHLAELARAISEGANVRTYDARSLLDNFEWADGYTPALRSHLCGFSRSEAHDKGLRAVVRARRWCELLGRVVHLRSILSANCNAERYRT